MEIAAKLGVRFTPCRKLPLMDGIEATRAMLRRVVIDEKRCREGLSYLQLYRSEVNEKTGVLNTRPLHDHTSHAADALRMFAVEYGAGRGKGWGSQINYDMLDRMAV